MPTLDPRDLLDDELRALLSDASVPAAAIAFELATAGADPLTTEALDAARAMLAAMESAPETVDPAALAALPPRLRSLALEAAATLQRLPVLTSLAAGSDKPLAKEAKRLLHALKVKGVAVAAPRPSPAPVAPAPSAPADEELPVLMSAATETGERSLFFARSVRGGVDIAQVLLREETGLVDARLYPVPRREYRKLLASLLETPGVLAAEVPRAYARHLVSAALDEAIRRRQPPPARWNEVAFVIGAACEATPAPARALLLEPLDESPEASARTLVAHPAIARWRQRAVTPTLLAERLYEAAWLFHVLGDAPHASRALAAARRIESAPETEPLVSMLSSMVTALPMAPADAVAASVAPL